MKKGEMLLVQVQTRDGGILYDSQVDTATLSIFRNRAEAPMIDITREVAPKQLQKAFLDADEPVFFESIGKKGATRDYSFVVSSCTGFDEDDCYDVVEAVDKEDAEFQALFYVAVEARSPERVPHREIFDAMERTKVLELEVRSSPRRTF